LCCALRAARRLSVAALFRLKIASSGRGALAGTRWAHLNCNDKKVEGLAGVEDPGKTSNTAKNIDQPKSVKKTVTYKFLSPLVGEHREQLRRRPRVG
jgi:hypothetical protein